MATQTSAPAPKQEQKGLLRLITCGSVDDGKSTLIGRLLYDSHKTFADQLEAVKTNESYDFAHLVDGLHAEREQGITIDVAYRYFSTDKRKFIIADTPGHEQYTRNMATGASTSDLAIILIDAEKGVLTQTRRHSYIVSLLGIKHVIVAVNKMDLVGYDQARYKAIQADYLKLAGQLDIPDIHFVPVVALTGDNVVQKSTNMPWFRGRTLMNYLETLTIDRALNTQDFRFPVQYVTRPGGELAKRGYAGSVVSGSIQRGDTIRTLPAGTISTVESITTYDGELEQAIAPQAVTLVLSDEIDVSRGDLIVDKDALPHMSNRLRARMVWMHEQTLLPGREYWVKLGTKTVSARCEKVLHTLDVNTLQEQGAENLALNDVGMTDWVLSETVVFDKYKVNRKTGAFIVIDKRTNATVAAGMVAQPLAEASAGALSTSDVDWHDHQVTPARRALLKQQKPAVVWFTGLSGAGKSTLANAVEELLLQNGNHTLVLDGDVIRTGLCADLGFSAEDRAENIRRAGSVARTLVDAGLIVLSAFISPFQADRAAVRDMLGAGEFIEVFVDTPLDVCAKRDPKGLYARAAAGEIPDFTGISSPYEAPQEPDLHIETAELEVLEAAQQVVALLRTRGFIR